MVEVVWRKDGEKHLVLLRQGELVEGESVEFQHELTEHGEVCVVLGVLRTRIGVVGVGKGVVVGKAVLYHHLEALVYERLYGIGSEKSAVGMRDFGLGQRKGELACGGLDSSLPGLGFSVRSIVEDNVFGAHLLMVNG